MVCVIGASGEPGGFFSRVQFNPGIVVLRPNLRASVLFLLPETCFCVTTGVLTADFLLSCDAHLKPQSGAANSKWEEVPESQLLRIKSMTIMCSLYEMRFV
jgi:hypothetical protein